MGKDRLIQRVLRFVWTAGIAALGCLSLGQVKVTTYHNDNLRTGLNSLETTLTPTTVTPSSFGLLFSQPVDGQVYAQPLYLPNLTIPGKGVHNVVFVATEHNSVYAFDADSNTGANAQPLWHVNFGAAVPNNEVGSDDIQVEIGITSTPVIYMRRTGTPLLYVISKTKTVDSGGATTYAQQLHALSVTTGAEQLGGPLTIQGSVAGTGEGSVNGTVTFNPLIQLSRAALLLVPPTDPGSRRTTLPVTAKDSMLYVVYASHGDNGPYHGWVFVYDADTLQFVKILNTTPNGLNDPSGYPIAAGGIWQGGFGPASDGQNIYFATGNGKFNPSEGSYGDSIVRVDAKTLTIADYFTPSNQENLDDYDADLGSGGAMLVPAQSSGAGKRSMLVQSGKEGTIYLLNTANMGKYHTTDAAAQELPYVMGGIWGGPAYFNNTLYYGPIFSPLVSFTMQNGFFSSTHPSAYSPTYYQYPGPTPSVSSNGLQNGIVWAIQTDNASSGSSAVLHAYDASNIGRELYSSDATQGRDALGGAIKFSTPTIASGKVFVGCSGSVGVFGLGTWAAAPNVSPVSGLYAGSVSVTITEDTTGASVYYTTDGSVPTTASTKYNGPVTLSSSCAFKAKAFKSGMGASAVVERDYLINAVVGTGDGLWGAYFDGSQDPSGKPTATEVDPVIDFNWNGASPIGGVGGSNWAGEWTGKIQTEVSGLYTFTTNTDDGVRIYINGQLVIDDYTYHAPTYDSGTILLVAGQKYDIDIKFFQGGGGSVLQLFWATPGLPQQIVPKTQLYSLH